MDGLCPRAELCPINCEADGVVNAVSAQKPVQQLKLCSAHLAVLR